MQGSIIKKIEQLNIRNEQQSKNRICPQSAADAFFFQITVYFVQGLIGFQATIKQLHFPLLVSTIDCKKESLDGNRGTSSIKAEPFLCCFFVEGHITVTDMYGWQHKKLQVTKPSQIGTRKLSSSSEIMFLYRYQLYLVSIIWSSK